jgi:MFS family permease
MTSAVILGMIVTMFTEPRERTRAISLYSFVASAGASIGLLAGGVLTEPSTGTGSSSSTPDRIVTGILACACSRTTRASGSARAPTASARSS